MHIASFYFS
jgi:hypothetical protein